MSTETVAGELQDLSGIFQLLRTHLSIRNRSWMKRVHRDCFIGSEAVDFLVTQGLADSREHAVTIGRAMVAKKMIRHVTDQQKFRDSYLYYRFSEDDLESSVLAASNAGNGSGIFFGQGGCKWAFCPHTAHNSYILDIGLAEELERAVAGASVEARLKAVHKLRARVREEAEPDAPDWILSQSTVVNKVSVSVYQRKRPRGDFRNVKITGMMAQTPRAFIAGIMNFEDRRQWEGMFEDGIVVEAVDTGETMCPILADEDLSPDGADGSGATAEVETPSLPEGLVKAAESRSFARKADDVITFLQTVDLAGIPQGMPIAFLNDPERQHGLAHLRKQMMLSHPEECMLCKTRFHSSAAIRFCPCCSMVSCASCVSKRVFEVVSRCVVSVCVHCYRESSRIRHSPQAVQDSSGIDVSVRGKWWRPEELGIADFSDGASSVASASMLDPNALHIDKNTRTLVPGLLDGIDIDNFAVAAADGEKEEVLAASPVEALLSAAGAERAPDDSLAVMKHESVDGGKKTARCKSCGEMISRDMTSIEQHMEECAGLQGGSSAAVTGSASLWTGDTDVGYSGTIKSLAGIARRPELQKCPTKIIYRTAKSHSKVFQPREVCAFQDAFMDADGTCYLYEVSVRHCDVRGLPGHVTADVLMLLHVARPIKGSQGTCAITTISQVDARAQTGNSWLLSFLSDESNNIGVPRREDLVRELKSSGDLLNILGDAQHEEGRVSLEDFDLLAVLGRGGFGKVMQVRHRITGEVYAMKILKKSELRRRRQVERTQTERTILAAVRHPFIVCLHYAFQNNQKLYMVMDFVQGGDFFTLMRKFRRLPEEWVRYYVAEIALALQHLHDMDVVYRDLKPENVLLCGDGYLKLTDFGLSRFFETRPPAAEDMITEDDIVTRSFCGTEQYMSPEMLLQQGHNYRMDWWCLGLLMHEMISARHPFNGASHYDTLRNMVTKQPTIDSRLSKNAVSVVRNLLIKNPRARLCCSEGINELKGLPFFAGLDWEELKEKRIKMPHAPDLRDSTDISSFETVFTREAPVDSISEQPRKDRAGKSKGLMGFLGLAADSAKAEEASDGDAFKDFAFAKDDEQE